MQCETLTISIFYAPALRVYRVRQWTDAGWRGRGEKGEIKNNMREKEREREGEGRKEGKGKCCWSSMPCAAGVGLWRAFPWALSSRPVTSVHSPQIKTTLCPATHSLHVTCPEGDARWLCLHDSRMTAGVLILRVLPALLSFVDAPATGLSVCHGWRERAELLSVIMQTHGLSVRPCVGDEVRYVSSHLKRSNSCICRLNGGLKIDIKIWFSIINYFHVNIKLALQFSLYSVVCAISKKQKNMMWYLLCEIVILSVRSWLGCNKEKGLVMTCGKESRFRGGAI